jgi:molybdopterin-guanine dinucleotide biosynthesis protein A
MSGGKSSRMGEDKAFLPFVDGITILEYILNQIENFGEEQIIIANDVVRYQHFGLPVFPDVLPDLGALGGIYSAIYHSSYDHCLILACDMPFVNLSLIEFMAGLSPDFDIVMPRWKHEEFAEPFRAIYTKTCLNPIEDAIHAGHKRVVSFFKDVKIRFIDAHEISSYDPRGLTFINVNTPEDLLEARMFAQEFNTKK